jgi:hypothetical protein
MQRSLKSLNDGRALWQERWTKEEASFLQQLQLLTYKVSREHRASHMMDLHQLIGILVTAVAAGMVSYHHNNSQWHIFVMLMKTLR